MLLQMPCNRTTFWCQPQLMKCQGWVFWMDSRYRQSIHLISPFLKTTHDGVIESQRPLRLLLPKYSCASEAYGELKKFLDHNQHLII